LRGVKELPIACSLDAEGLAARAQEYAALGRRSLISVSQGKGARVLLRFTADKGTRATLDRMVAAEAECCPFLEITVREGGALELTIDGPDEAGPVIAELASTIAASG
jgi:hypothetical protein